MRFLFCADCLRRPVRDREAMGDYASIPIVDASDSGITFSGFILSLATTAAVHFGDIVDRTPEKAHRTCAAAQMIELIAPSRRRPGQSDRAGSQLVATLSRAALRHTGAAGRKRIIEPSHHSLRITFLGTERRTAC
jgi:hypothetical protein